MINVFDITEYGAVGDGVTDCTESIQKAMDLAEDCRGKIVVPPGNYNVKGDLKFRGEAVSLEGCSSWTYRGNGASTFTLTNENAECLMDISGAVGCKITGMTFNGNKLGKNIHGIRLWWPVANGGGQEDTPNIDDCKVYNFSGDGLHFNHIWCFAVRHSFILSNGGAGIRMSGWDAFLTDNWISNNDGGGLVACDYVAAITATGNRVEWNKTGGFIIPRGDSCNFTGNFFDRTFGPALELGCDDGEFNLATVTGNVFRRGGCYVDKPHDNPDRNSHMILNHCTGCVITGNTMKVGAGDGGTMPVSPDFGMIIRNCDNTIVKDNAMRNGSMINNLITENNTDCIIENNIGTTAG